MRITPELYSYPVEVVAQWCGVSLRTAAAWKSGVSAMSAQAAKLFELHRDGRVLADKGWGGWKVQGEWLIDPEGNRTTQGQLRAYALIIQYHLERARLDRDAAALLPELGPVHRIAGGSEP